MARSGSTASKPPRPGGHELSPEVLTRYQRQRILQGAAKAIAEGGYRETSVADIVRSAAIARARFYEIFSSKEDCFFALYDEAVAAALAATSTACNGVEDRDFQVRLRSGLSALLAQVASDPPLARAIVIGGPAVGTAIGSRFERLISDFAELLRVNRQDPGSAKLAGTVEEAVVGGLYWMLYYALLEPGGLDPDALLDQFTEYALVPLLGSDGPAMTAG